MPTANENIPLPFSFKLQFMQEECALLCQENLNLPCTQISNPVIKPERQVTTQKRTRTQVLKMTS